MRKVNNILFLNFCIFLNKYWISIDQSNHVKQKILHEYFPDTTKDIFQATTFLVCSKLKMTLFAPISLDNDEHLKMVKIHHGLYNHWTGAIIHIAGMNRQCLDFLSIMHH